MAFESVNRQLSGTAKKVRDLEVGGELVGYVTGFEPSLQNPENMNMIMRGEDGTTFRVYTAGNIKYMIKDGKIQTGLLTKIVRLADKNIKGKISSQFDVLQDPESTLADALFNEIAQPPQAAAKPATSISQQGAVANKAKELAAKVAGQVRK
jgi:hypothetical protein